MVRGLLKAEEQPGKKQLRDVRTMWERIPDFYKEPRNGALVILAAAIASFMPVFMAFSDFLFVICIIIFWYCMNRKSKLPFRLPETSHLPDYNDLAPGTSQPRQARGIYFYGNELDTNEELWFSNEDMRTHTLIFGSTGSGKTEFLISLAFNALIQGSGFIYVDGKGDNTLFSKIFSMARAVGREDDVLVINYMTGARDIVGPQPHRLSNTMNPFARGSSSMLSQLVVSMMDSASHTPDGDMWKGRAISFVEALMKTLVYARDQGIILLDANTIRNYFLLERLESMVLDKMFPRDNDEPVSLADADPVILEPLYNYVINLPGYDRSRKGKQVSQVLEQHGFITMQLTRVFTSLADTYGHILRTNLAEVDLKDVVLNRRILVVLLPALEKSPVELSNLGKIIIASLRVMMASGLGEEVEGAYKDIILRKPTNAPNPFLCILDEYGYYAVQGFAVVPAQARSLGFSVVFAGQDLPAFQKVSKEEAASIGANTNIKIAMKLEDPMETWEFFNKTASEAYVAKVDSFRINPNGVLNFYGDALSASMEKRQRISLLDLKDQVQGDAHIFFRSTIVRDRTFYANPKPVSKMRLNIFMRVQSPSDKQLLAFARRIDTFTQLMRAKDFVYKEPEANTNLSFIADTLKNDKAETFIERGVATLLAYHNKDANLSLEAEVEEEARAEGRLNVFTKVNLTDVTKQIVSADELPAFSEILLKKSLCGQKIEFSERLCGKTEKQASNLAKELLKDMQTVTDYPPAIQEPPDVDAIVKWIGELSASLETMKGNDDLSNLF
ncbi:MAG: TraM recognition domain-containing protein, partial [Gammaproteobacteria bacterium]|nr:TraM recognition domain-containing protein [Gammaproteobacteria bacterium]